MNSSHVSRRDWFRLRLRNGETQAVSECRQVDSEIPVLDPSLNGSYFQKVPLAPMPAPPNHTGLDLSQLPPVSEAILDSQELDSLLDDIGQLTTHVSLKHRGLGDRLPPQSQPQAPNELDVQGQLELARNGLKSGVLQRLQIRYTWQDASWIDTLETKSPGYRIVRIRHAN